MKFNQYTWNLYKQSSDGQKAIKEFEEPSNNDTMMDLVFKYNPRMKLWFNDDKSRLSISNIVLPNKWAILTGLPIRQI